MKHTATIERYHTLLEKCIAYRDPPLDYDRTINALESMANACSKSDITGEEISYIGDCSYSLDAIIVGAYWHLTEWHSGQWSDSYRAMCALGEIFNPGMADGPEPESCENDVYQMLNELAESNEKETAA